MIRPVLLAPFLLAGTALVTVASPVAAQQQSEGYKFLQAVRDAKNDEVIAAVEKPGSRIVDTRDVTNGDGALHIVTKRGDAPYLNYLLQHGADPNLRDAGGNSPLMIAVGAGQVGLIPLLLTAHANPNLGNTAGETPLIRAVQRRDVATARVLVNGGANPDQTDRMAGLSAREYASRDARSPAMVKLFDEVKVKPKAAVAGPRL